MTDAHVKLTLMKFLRGKMYKELSTATQALSNFWERVNEYEQVQGDAMYRVHETFQKNGFDADDVEKFIRAMKTLNLYKEQL